MSHDEHHDAHHPADRPSKHDRELVRFKHKRHEITSHHEPTFVDQTSKLSSEDLENLGIFFDYIDLPSQVECKIVRKSRRVPLSIPTLLRHKREALKAVLDTSSEEEDVDMDAIMDTDSDPEEFDMNFDLRREKSPKVIEEDCLSSSYVEFSFFFIVSLKTNTSQVPQS